MKNIFILANTDVQFADVEDPLVYYNKELKTLALEFWSTVKEEWWNRCRDYIFGSPDNAATKTRVQFKWLGVNDEKYQSGGLSSDWAYYTQFKKWTDKCCCVVSSNYAHCLSAMLCRAAFDNHGMYGIKTVLNIDFHEDYGSLKSPILKADGKVGNGSWGQEHVCRPWPAIENREIVVIYAVFGVEKNQGSIFWRVSKSKHLDKDLPQKRTGAEGDIFERLKKILYAPTDLYITVDRDVLGYGRTHFNESPRVAGAYNREKVSSRIKDILDARTVNLVGFDITGLPMYRYKTGNPNTEKDATACSNAVEDIKKWHALLSPYCK